jgi:hypothetical protein
MIDKMAKDFEDLAELQAYCNAQYHTIITLNKKINELDEENKELRKLIENNKILIGSEKQIKDLFANVEDPEAIALMQLKLLRNLSIERDLSLEEAKKWEIYCKVLFQVNEKKGKQKQEQSQQLSTEDLLKAMQGLDSSDSKVS